MRNFIVLALFLSLCTIVQGAESNLSKSFLLKSDISKVGKWIDENPDELLKVAGNQIVKRTGSRIKLSRVTPKGKFVFTIEESSNKDKTKFNTQLIESDTKEMIAQDTTIILSKKSGKTHVEIILKAQVDRRDISPVDIRVDLDRSARRIKSILEEKF
jgi:hypothetical protein